MSSQKNTRQLDPGCAAIIAAVIGAIALIIGAVIGAVFGAKSQPVQVFLGVPTPTSINLIAALQPTYTPYPTLTPNQVIVTQVSPPNPTYTPYATNTPYPTYTPYPTVAMSPTITRIPTATTTPTPIGMVSKTLAVPDKAAQGGWIKTDLFLKKGDAISIRFLSGSWWIGQDVQGNWSPQQPTDAAGYTGRDGDKATALVGGAPDRCKVLSNAPYGSLIGRIGDPGPSFLVGNSLDYKSPADGLLYLGINYINHNFKTNCPYGDGGEITISISILPSS